MSCTYLYTDSHSLCWLRMLLWWSSAMKVRADSVFHPIQRLCSLWGTCKSSSWTGHGMTNIYTLHCVTSPWTLLYTHTVLHRTTRPYTVLLYGTPFTRSRRHTSQKHHLFIAQHLSHRNFRTMKNFQQQYYLQCIQNLGSIRGLLVVTGADSRVKSGRWGCHWSEGEDSIQRVVSPHLGHMTLVQKPVESADFQPLT